MSDFYASEHLAFRLRYFSVPPFEVFQGVQLLQRVHLLGVSLIVAVRGGAWVRSASTGEVVIGFHIYNTIAYQLW